MCSAFISGIHAPQELVSNQAFNVGIVNGNYSVLDLAKYAEKNVDGSYIEIRNETGHDERTYNVSFKKIYKNLGDFYKPIWTIDKGAKEILSFFKKLILIMKCLKDGKQID